MFYFQVEVMPGMGSEDEEDENEMIAMEGADGQQYVVLEVIQLADGDEQTVRVLREDQSDILNETILQDNGL